MSGRPSSLSLHALILSEGRYLYENREDKWILVIVALQVKQTATKGNVFCNIPEHELFQLGKISFPKLLTKMLSV